MGKKGSSMTKGAGKVLNVVAPGAGALLMGMGSRQAKDEKALASAQQEAESKGRALETAQKELDAAKEAEAQQEAVRKKMASLGRLQAGYTFSDSQASTGATKVFS